MAMVRSKQNVGPATERARRCRIHRLKSVPAGRQDRRWLLPPRRRESWPCWTVFMSYPGRYSSRSWSPLLKSIFCLGIDLRLGLGSCTHVSISIPSPREVMGVFYGPLHKQAAKGGLLYDYLDSEWGLSIGFRTSKHSGEILLFLLSGIAASLIELTHHFPLRFKSTIIVVSDSIKADEI